MGLSTLLVLQAHGQGPVIPPLENSQEMRYENGWRVSGGIDAVYWNKDDAGNTTWIHGDRLQLGAATNLGPKTRPIHVWTDWEQSRDDGPFHISGADGEFDSVRVNREAGIETPLWRSGWLGGAATSGNLHLSATSPDFIQYVYAPLAPTFSVDSPEDSESLWIRQAYRGVEAEIGHVWRTRSVMGTIPSADLSSTTSVPVSAMPDTNRLALRLHRGGDWKFEAESGSRSGYQNIVDGTGLALIEGSEYTVRASHTWKARALGFSYSQYVGDGQGVLADGSLLGIGLPHDAVVNYDSSIRGRIAELFYDLPVRMPGGEGKLRLGHVWFSGDVQADYTANVLFGSTTGSTGTTIGATRCALLRFEWTGKGKTARPFVALQQLIPYYEAKSAGSGGPNNGGWHGGRVYGGGSLDIGVTGTLPW